MSTISFHGRFHTGNPEMVQQALSSWLSPDELRMRPRRGWEMHYESEGTELLCYEAAPENADDFFLLEGHIDGKFEAAVVRLRSLAEYCRNTRLKFSIDYEEVDADGNPISEEKTIS